MYGNGVKINIGNETGGIIVNSIADLFYTDLIEIRKKGIFTAVSQSSYLYFFFLSLCSFFNIKHQLVFFILFSDDTAF